MCYRVDTFDASQHFGRGQKQQANPPGGEIEKVTSEQAPHECRDWLQKLRMSVDSHTLTLGSLVMRIPR